MRTLTTVLTVLGRAVIPNPNLNPARQPDATARRDEANCPDATCRALIVQIGDQDALHGVGDAAILECLVNGVRWSELPGVAAVPGNPGCLAVSRPKTSASWHFTAVAPMPAVATLILAQVTRAESILAVLFPLAGRFRFPPAPSSTAGTGRQQLP